MTKPARFPTIPDLDLPGLVDQRLTGAACAGHAPLFDATRHGENEDRREHRHHQARTICHQCPVRATCKTVANELPAAHRTGIWAGTTWKESA